MLGRSGIEVSALGLGCWAIGGPFEMDGRPDGWGDIDDGESLRAIEHAIELGVTFFDTADVYGIGHSEEVLGRAIRGRRDQLVIATKFGFTYDVARNAITGTNVTPAYIRQACEASLRRLGSDYIDLYQLHVGDVAAADAEAVWHTLDQLRQEGKIRAYGWSTANVEGADAYAGQSGGATLQFGANVLLHDPQLFELCTRHGLASVANSPLAMGLLSGKFSERSRLPADDVRGSGHSWVAYFEGGRPRQEFLDQLAAVREILTSEGRTLVQGALAWLWAQGDFVIPIPGFKTRQQAEENALAMRAGPLTPEQVREIAAILPPA
jgi:aryl-alcohol dehydrogenase-like predicted oxidoreductase